MAKERASKSKGRKKSRKKKKENALSDRIKIMNLY